jgi:lysozyme
MVYSKAGVALTESFEACRLTAYQDVKGVWTIGVGHTGPEVKEGLVWTQEFADTMLIADVSTAVYCVNVSVTIPLSQGEFDAIVDFAFNCGCAAFKGSTMLKDINAGNLAGAADEFARWDHASGQVVAGLLRRRIAEEQEFKS